MPAAAAHRRTGRTLSRCRFARSCRPADAAVASTTRPAPIVAISAQLRLTNPNASRGPRSPPSAAHLRRDRRRAISTSPSRSRQRERRLASVHRGRGGREAGHRAVRRAWLGPRQRIPREARRRRHARPREPERGLPRRSGSARRSSGSTRRLRPTPSTRRSPRSPRTAALFTTRGRTARCMSCSATASRSPFASRTAAGRPSA